MTTDLPANVPPPRPDRTLSSGGHETPPSNGFDPQWLALREPVDHASRAERPLTALTTWRAERCPENRPLVIRDLGSGAGSNFRFLAPLLGGRQHWTLIDNDPALLLVAMRTISRWAEVRGAKVTPHGNGVSIEAPNQTRSQDQDQDQAHDGGWSARVETTQADLARHPIGPNGAAPDLITASAVLDLVSERWLNDLAAGVRATGAAVHFALSYDGTMAFEPASPMDDLIRAGFNLDQTRDKGFGPALGPDGAGTLAAILDRAGFSVTSASSPWRLSAETPQMALMLVDGIAAAATQSPTVDGETVAGWHRDWRARLKDSTTRPSDWAITVGHLDLTAVA